MDAEKLIKENTPLFGSLVDIILKFMAPPPIIDLKTGNPADIKAILDKLSEQGSGSVRTHVSGWQDCATDCSQSDNLNWEFEDEEMKFTNVSNGRSSWADNYTHTTNGKLSLIWDIEEDELRRVAFSFDFLIFSNDDFEHIEKFKGFENRNVIEDYYACCNCYMCREKREESDINDDSD